MKKKMKAAAFLLALSMLASLPLAGCSGAEGTSEPSAPQAGSKNEQASGNPEVDAYQAEAAQGDKQLIFWMIGDGTADQQMANDLINTKMKEQINTTLDTRYAPWADWQTKYQLLFNSGEQFDACFTTSWADYSGLLKKGGFYNLTEEMVKTYMPNFAPQLFDDTHKYLWADSDAEGVHGIVPQIYDWKNKYVVIIRGDLREKYNIPEIKTLDDIYTYAMAIGDQEPGLTPYSDLANPDKFLNALGVAQGWKGIAASLSYSTITDDGKVFNMLETPAFISWAKKMREMQEAGAFSKSALSSKTDSSTNFKAGKSAIYIDGFGGPLGMYMDLMKSNPEFKPEIYDFAKGVPNQVSPPLDGGMSVYAGSKNPERSLMAIDLLMGVREYNDILALGVPGTHWNAVGDDKYELLSKGSESFPPYSACPWGLNTNFMRVDKDTPDFAAEFRREWADEIKTNQVDGFIFNEDTVKNELSAIKAAYLADMPAIIYGMNKDAEKAVTDLNEKLKKLGMDKVMEEVQKQLDAYNAD